MSNCASCAHGGKKQGNGENPECSASERDSQFVPAGARDDYRPGTGLLTHKSRHKRQCDQQRRGSEDSIGYAPSIGVEKTCRYEREKTDPREEPAIKTARALPRCSLNHVDTGLA